MKHNIIKNLKNQKIRYFFILLAITTICHSCYKNKMDFNEQFTQNLTSDSIGYWDYFPDEYKYGIKDGPIDTYGFNKNGTLEFYSMRYGFEIGGYGDSVSLKTSNTIGKRMFVRLDTVARPPFYKTNKWKITNDSIFTTMNVYGYKIMQYSKDSIFMKQVSYHGRPYEDSIKRFHILHRVKENDLRLDERSKILKDSIDRLSR